jgi:hypothetical protein
MTVNWLGMRSATASAMDRFNDATRSGFRETVMKSMPCIVQLARQIVTSAL